MNEIDPNKYKRFIKNDSKKKYDNNIKRFLINLSFRSLVVVIILLSLAIIYKSDIGFNDSIYNYFFKDNISFVQINKLYDKYLGGLLPVKKKVETTPVFNEKLNYNDCSIYYDGVKLSVDNSYLVPVIEEGMVVFIGEKENYGNTIIVENLEGIDYWYGNINSTSLKLYDYVEKGSLVGEVSNDLYMVFSKGDNYLNYEEYIY